MADPAQPPDRVTVLLPLPVGDGYDYRVPPGLSLAPGDLVRVPLGNRERDGVVWAAGAGAGDATVADSRLKDVLGKHDCPPFSDLHRRFLDWVASYVLRGRGQILRMALSVPDALEPPRRRRCYRAAEPAPDAAGIRMTEARRRVLAVLSDGFARDAKSLAAEAVCSPAVVTGLADAGLIQAVDLPPPAFPAPDPHRTRAVLSPDQAAAAASLAEKQAAGGFSATLLDGVTGSGKTEVYFEAIARTLAQGRQVLVLLPEIALSAQWLDRFQSRFGCRPVLWHSEVTGADRRRAWRGAATWAGQAGSGAQIVVGARSALFLPYADLGLIIVDEEHEAAYKQEDGVAYHARDMAVARARLGQIPVLLVSATPAVETVMNVRWGRYDSVRLPARHGGAALPAVEILDRRRARAEAAADTREPGQVSYLSDRLLAAVRDAIGAGHQALLFLNRRGYAPLTLCGECGHRLQCPNCSAWLVHHRLRGRLTCHHCGHSMGVPAACPSCEAKESWIACGPGVERIAEEVDRRLPEARWFIATSDTLRTARDIETLVAQMTTGQVNVLIGTQILAKGHHFPDLTVVGVVDADLGFDTGGDIRAFERTFQLLQQVAGRAGRGQSPGTVILQSHDPENPVLAAIASGDRDGFLDREIAMRGRGRWPPFGRLVAVIVSGTDRDALDRHCRLLAAARPNLAGVEILGPADAPLALLRGRHRKRFLARSDRKTALQKVVADWLTPHPPKGSIRVTVDVDPYSFL